MDAMGWRVGSGLGGFAEMSIPLRTYTSSLPSRLSVAIVGIRWGAEYKRVKGVYRTWYVHRDVYSALDVHILPL